MEEQYNMVTIVYVSNSGFTKKYAELLAAEIKADCFSLEEAKTKLVQGKPVIFLGWLAAGIIQGYKKAKKRYEIKAVAGVGMGAVSQKVLDDLVRQNQLEGIKSDYLRGGFDLAKLKGVNKWMMSLGAKAVVKTRGKKKDLTPEQAERLSDFKYGCNHVSKDNLKKILAYCQTL